jgi:hypothetical protein
LKPTRSGHSFFAETPVDRLFSTKEAYLADLKERRDAMQPLMDGIDWRGMTRPPRDPAERAFFKRLGIPSRFAEITEPAPPSGPPPGEQEWADRWPIRST